MQKHSRLAIALYVTIVATVLIAMLGASFYGATGRLRSAASAAQRAFIEQVIRSIEGRLAAIDLALINVGFDLPMRQFMEGYYTEPAERSQSMQTLQTQLRTIAALNPEVRSVSVYSEALGLVLTDSSMEGTDWSPDREWILEWIGAPPLIRWSGLRVQSVAQNDILVNYPTVSLVRPYPMTTLGPDARGLLVANVNPRSLRNAVTSTVAGAPAHVIASDSDGELIFATTNRAAELFTEIGPALLAMSGGYLQTDLAYGSDTYAVFAQYSGISGWRIAALVPRPQMDHGIAALRNVLLAVAVALAVIGAVAVVIVTRWTQQPVDEFVRSVAHAVATRAPGVLPISLDESPTDLGALERLVNTMVDEHANLQDQVVQSKQAIRWQAVLEILTGANASVPFSERQSSLSNLGIALGSGAFSVLVVQIDRTHRLPGTVPRRELALYGSMLCRKAEQLAEMSDASAAVELWDGRIAVLMTFGQADANALRMTSYATAEALRDFARSALDTTVTIGVSSVTTDPSSIPRCYREAVRCLDYRVVIGGDSVISDEDIAQPEQRNLYRLQVRSDEVVSALRGCDEALLADRIRAWFASARELRLPVDILRQFVLHLLMVAVGEARDLGLDIEVAPLPSDVESLAQLERHVEEAAAAIHSARAGARRSRHASALVTHATEYIGRNFGESNLSLALLADSLGVSVSHLSRQFKEVTGGRFLDYLISIRVSRAKELLLEDQRISEVATAVGYTNPHSFLRIFKQATGMTPGDYRIKARLEQAVGDLRGEDEPFDKK